MTRKSAPAITFTLGQKLAADLQIAASTLRLPLNLYIRRSFECAVGAAAKFDTDERRKLPIQLSGQEAEQELSNWTANYEQETENKSMTIKDITLQIADSGLLDKDLATRITVGEDCELNEIVSALVYGSRDCEVATRNDTTSTWNEKRLARGCLVIAFLTALQLTQTR